MKGVYTCELVRDNKVISKFQKKNYFIQATGNYVFGSLCRNLYSTTAVDYPMYDYQRPNQFPPLSPYYLETFSQDYPSKCPPPITSWYMGLAKSDSTKVFNDLVLEETGELLGPNDEIVLSSPQRMREEINYLDKDGNAQRPLWEPDDPVKGTLTNTVPTEFFFTADAQVFALFLMSSPVFLSGLFDPVLTDTVSDYVIHTPSRMLSFAGLPFNTDSTVFNPQGDTFSPKAGDTFRVHYMVYF